MKNTILYIFVFLFSLQACKRENDASYFNGEIVYVAVDSVPVTFIKGNTIDFNEVYAGLMSAYDSLILFVSHKFSDQWLYVFNLNTYRLESKLLSKGQGPEDFLYFSHTEQYFLQDNSIKLWGWDALEGKIVLLNLTQSIREQKAIIDSTLFLEWKDKYSVSFGYIFVCNNGSLLARSPVERERNPLEKESDYIPLDYHLYKPSGENIRSYGIYNPNGRQTIPFEDIYSWDRMKPDQTKLSMGMYQLAQINILDIETGKIKGFRLKNTPGFKDLAKEDAREKYYYIQIRVDDSYIYGLFNHGDRIFNHGENIPFATNELHVFNWDGQFVHKILLDSYTGDIAFDPVKKRLFNLNVEDQLLVYDLSFLY